MVVVVVVVVAVVVVVVVVVVLVVVVVVRAFAWFLPEERGKRGLSWTSAEKAVQNGRAKGVGFAATDCACVGFGAIRAGGFQPGTRWRLENSGIQ